MEDYKYMVATRCFTYNQKPFIEKTIQGFLMQNVSFPTVYIIVDDASTDGESELLHQWADNNLAKNGDQKLWKEKPYGKIAVAQNKNNEKQTFVVLLLSENHFKVGKNRLKLDYVKEWLVNSKYHALCEGDDYWTDPNKLQMQFDFMESHPDYVLCHTDFNLSDGSFRNHGVYQKPDDDYFDINVRSGIDIGTLTVLYRAEVYYRLPKQWVGKGWLMGDYPMWIEMSHEGKMKYMPVVTACYRVTTESASHGSFEKEIQFANSAVEVRRFYAHYYGVSLPKDGYTQSYFISVMKKAYKHHQPEAAQMFLKQAKVHGLLNKKIRFFYLATCVKPLGWLLKLVYSV